MPQVDPFTLRRIEKFVTDFRNKSGQLPTLQNFETAGFHPDSIKSAVKDGQLVELFITLTNGSIVKGFKFSDQSRL